MDQIKQLENYIPISSLGDTLSPQSVTEGLVNLRLCQAALEVQSTGIESTSTLSFHGKEYQARSVNDVMRVIPPILNKYGITYVPKVSKVEVRNYEVSKIDKYKNNAVIVTPYSEFIIWMDFRIECAEDRSFIEYGPIISQADANDTYHNGILIGQRKGIRDFLLNITGMSAQEPDENGATVSDAVSVNREPGKSYSKPYTKPSTSQGGYEVDVEKNNKRLWAIYYDFLAKSKDLSTTHEKASLWTSEYRHKFIDPDTNQFIGQDSLRSKLEEVITPLMASRSA